MSVPLLTPRGESSAPCTPRGGWGDAPSSSSGLSSPRAHLLQQQQQQHKVKVPESAVDGARVLHYALTISSRDANLRFFANLLGMYVLRHEEFEAEDDQQPGRLIRWSKSVLAYGAEETHTALELTYYYGHRLDPAKRDPGFNSLRICSDSIFARVAKTSYPTKNAVESVLPTGEVDVTAYTLESPDGYGVVVTNSARHPARGASRDPISAICVNVNNMAGNLSFWQTYGMTLEQSVVGSHAVLRYSKLGCRLVLMLSKTAKLRRSSMSVAMPSANEDPSSESEGRVVVGVRSVEDVESAARDSMHMVVAPMSSVELPDDESNGEPLNVLLLADSDKRPVTFVSVPSYYVCAAINPGARKRLLDSIKNEVQEACARHY